MSHRGNPERGGARHRGGGRLGRALLFLFVVFMMVPVSVGGITLYKIAGILASFYVLMGLKKRRRIHPMADRFAFAILVVLLSGLLGSIAFGNVNGHAVQRMTLNLILLVVIGELTTTARDLRVVMLAAGLGGMVSVVSGLVMPGAAELGGRAAGLIGNPNGYGQLSARTLIVMVGMALIAHRKTSRWVFLALTVPALAGVLYSASRGATIALVFGVLALVVLQPMRRAGIVVAVIVALGVLWMAPPEFYQRVSSVLHSSGSKQTGLGRRVELGRHGVDLWRNHPFFGVGSGNALEGMQLAAFERPQVTHSVFIQSLAETGTLGFMGFFFVVVMTAVGFYHIAKMKMIDQELRVLSATFLAVFVVLAVGESSSGSYIHSIWYIVFGVVKNMEVLARKGTRLERARRRMIPIPIGRRQGGVCEKA